MQSILNWVTWLLSTALIAGPAYADLRSYVQRPDPAFRWTLKARHSSEEGSTYRLKLISQVWQGVAWEHALDVYVPARVETPDKLLLFVSGAAPSSPNTAFGLRIAQAARAPCAILYDIPNQPLLDGKYEDDLIAETFSRFLATGDEDWPLLLPMTRSVVKAMDALQAFAQQQLQHPLERFVITGASKRGWTSWLSAAVDSRIVAIAPRVFDILNMAAQMPHQLASWGAYSEMLRPYTEPGLPSALTTGTGRRLIDMVDPYAYRAELDVPKLIMLGTNDRYWTLDALNLYWSALPGAKYISYTPNAGHDLVQHGAWEQTLVCFFRHIASGQPLPRLEWQRSRDGDRLRIAVDARPAPGRAWLQYSTAPTRDFREAHWQTAELSVNAGPIAAEMALSDTDFVAAFVDVEYTGDGPACRFSTQIDIQPPLARSR